tara:strand:+ start:2487 stop:3842 length:1356 start_codon:yes stop_codon:yes gene_type:complete
MTSGLSPWIQSRLQTIYASIVDILIILIFFSFLYINESSLPKDISYLLLAIIIVWVLSSYVMGRYSFKEKRKSYTMLKQVIFSIFSYLICTIFYLIINFFNPDPIITSNNTLLIIILSFGLVVTSPIIQIKFFAKNNFESLEKWFYIGESDSFKYLSDFLESKKINIKIDKLDLIYNDWSRLQEQNIKGIVIENINNIDPIYYKKILELKFKGLEILSAMNWSERVLECFPSKLIKDKYLILDGFSFPKGSLELRIKRLGDFLLALFLIFSTFPLVIISSIFIYLEDRGPIFYSQIRTGYGGKLFRIYKLRSMRVNAEDKGVQWSQKGDKRITFIGNFLRKLRIDELPQLWCVLTGKMSLIGPRPERPEFDKDLEKKIPYYNYRYFIRPGLSGWAQVNYPYGARIEDAKNKLSYDFFYIRNFSFLLDLVILLKTIRLVFNAKGSIANPKNE